MPFMKCLKIRPSRVESECFKQFFSGKQWNFSLSKHFYFSIKSRLIAICMSSYHACMIIFSFVATKHLDIASYIPKYISSTSTALTVYLTDKKNVVGSHWKVGVGYFTHHEVGRTVENACSSLNINRFSLHGTLDYHLLKTIWDSSTLGETRTTNYTSLTVMILQSA